APIQLVTAATSVTRSPRVALTSPHSANRPSGTRMNPIIAKRWEATHAPDDMAACAPAAVDSSRHGRTAGYRTNITPASARARAPRRVRVAVVAIGDSVRGDMAAVKHLDRVSRNRGPRTSHSQCEVRPSV